MSRQRRCCFLSAWLVSFSSNAPPTMGWVLRKTPISRTRLSTRRPMISNIFNKETDQSLPRDVKQAVSRCRQATQDALQNRVSRMDIEFPVGTRFGVEKGSKKGSSGEPTLSDLQKSDRELARLFVEMFQPVGGDQIVVAFSSMEQANAAKKQWKNDPSAASRIVSMDRRRKSSSKKKKQKAKGFAAKLAAEVDDDSSTDGPFELPPDTEVALFVAPGPKEWVVIEKICEKVGMGTLVVLLNARLSTIANFGSAAAKKLFLDDFEAVFHLAAAPQTAAPNCLYYRAYPGEWIVARKPTVGQPKTILVQPNKPTEAESREAFENLELSDVERGVENMVENVSNWFR